MININTVTPAVILAGLLGAICWNLITWYFGLPSSSSHALIGGLIGVALGLATAATVRATVPSLPTDVPVWAPLIGLAVSMGVGILFGLWPAVKASRLDPVEALRYE